MKLGVTSHENNKSYAFFPSGCELTVGKCLPNIVLHCHNIGPIELGGIHELTLVRAARQLTEEVHQVEETGRTPARGI